MTAFMTLILRPLLFLWHIGLVAGAPNADTILTSFNPMVVIIAISSIFTGTMMIIVTLMCCYRRWVLSQFPCTSQTVCNGATLVANAYQSPPMHEAHGQVMPLSRRTSRISHDHRRRALSSKLRRGTLPPLPVKQMQGPWIQKEAEPTVQPIRKGRRVCNSPADYQGSFLPHFLSGTTFSTILTPFNEENYSISPATPITASTLLPRSPDCTQVPDIPATAAPRAFSTIL